MKKFLALFGAAALLAGLCGCSQTPKPDAAEETVEIPTNDTEYVFQPVVDPASENTGTLAGGGAVTVVTGPGGTESGAEAALWQGVNTFAYNFGYVPKSASAISDSVEDAAEVLRQTADTGAQVIVCRGDTKSKTSTPAQPFYCLMPRFTMRIIPITKWPIMCTVCCLMRPRPAIWRALLP